MEFLAVGQLISFMNLKVLYEDNHLIAVIKPFNMPVQGDDTGDICLMDAVKDYIKEKYEKSGKVFLGLLHRLDRPAGGIVLFAKTSKGAARLSKQIREHKFQKTYFAVLEGELSQKSDSLVDFLLRDKQKNLTGIVKEGTPGSQRAELDFEVLRTKNNKTLVQINLKTGRHHQIRAQFSHLGFPLLGDIKYGAKKPLSDKSIALFAGGLEFETATGSKKIELKADLPDYFSF